MSLGYFLAIIAGLIYGLLSLAYKWADVRRARSAHFTFILSITGALASLIKALTEQSIWSDPRLWLLGGAMGLVIVAGIFSLLAANRQGPVYASWTIINVSFLFAILLSIVILHERLLCVDPLNLFVFAIALYFFVHGMKKTILAGRETYHVWKHAGMLLLVFIFNGLATFGSKLKFTFWAHANTSALPTVFYLSSALLCLLLIYRQERRLRFTRDELKTGFAAGILISTGTIIFLTAMSLPAAAVFTICQGVSLTSGVLLNTLVGRERLNSWTVLGLFFGLILLFLVIFREPLALWMCG
jgi:drug/metabolite transporter (DMT)-like permease